MLSRRHLRIKTLQALYAFFQSGNDNIASGEKSLNRNINKLYDLYIFQLDLIIELRDFISQRQEEAKKKFFPSEEDLNPNTRFVDNMLIRQWDENEELLRRREKLRIHWREEVNLLLKLYNDLKQSKKYKVYLNDPSPGYRSDKDIVSHIVIDFISEYELLRAIYEDRDIFWSDADFDISLLMVLKTINHFKQGMDSDEPLPDIYKDRSEDRDYMVTLFRKTIIRSKEFEDLVEKKATNWELERIAIMDMIILKMALAEILEFQNIPVKVSINEYIELSKIFSSSKSRVFINGILDKLIQELKSENKINKTGRGLINS
jgi:N utilization substance protein B